MLGGSNRFKLTICSLNKKILIYENDVPIGFFFLTWTDVAL